LPAAAGEVDAHDSKSMLYYVYVLVSLKDGYRYIGMTDNIERRFQQHERGQSKSTKNHLPVSLYTKKSIERDKKHVIERNILKLA
jgi:putative endonuclease